MGKFLTIFLITLFTLSGVLLSGNYQKVRVYISSAKDLESITKLGIDFEGSRYKKDTFIDLQISLEEKSRIENAGFATEVLIDDLEQYYAAPTQPGYGFGYGSMKGNYTLSEVLSQLDSMANQYPNLISTQDTIGYSTLLRPIVAVKISDNPNIQENEPEVLYTGLHHAREPGSMMSTLYYMWFLLENYGTDPQATFLVENRQMWFIPVTNPDGYAHNEQTNPNGGGMWRKNARDNNDNGQNFDYYDGVDLNRNYGFKWGYDNSGSSPSPSSETYRGPSAFSEPETQVIRDFCNQHQFKTAFNYHSYGNLLIKPWAYLDGPTPDDHLFQTFGLDLTQFNGYTLGTPGQTVGYPVNGDANDWMYGEQISKPKVIAYTPEIGNDGDGFWPSQSRILPLAQENLYPNIVLSYIAGSFPKLYDYAMLVYGQNNYPDPGEVVEITPSVTNYGLNPSSQLSVNLATASPQVEIWNDQVSFPSMNTFDSLTAASSWQFKIKYDTPVGTRLRFDIRFLENGTPVNIDSLVIAVGTPSISFEDDAESGIGQWSHTGSWNLTTGSYHSASHSFTDSPYGEYPNNADYWLKTQSIDLTNVNDATLVYWTKWEIESSWDFGLVEISTNGGSSWTHLVGHYMHPASGNGTQQPGLHGYDGIHPTWVKDEIDLSNYTGHNVQIRFRLLSDGYVTEDGWYVDDISIQSLGANTNIPPYIQSVTQLSNPPYTGSPYPVESVVLDDSGIDHVNLLYSTDGGANYTTVQMTASDTLFIGTIPALSPGSNVQYYIEAWDNSGAYSRYPFNAPTGTLSFTIQAAGPAISVNPVQLNFTLPQLIWQVKPLTIFNPGTDPLTYQITDENVSSKMKPAINGKRKTLVTGNRILGYLKQALAKSDLKNLTPPEPEPLSPGNSESIVISDSTGDTNLPGLDIISVDYNENLLNYSISIQFAGPPDSSGIGILSIDKDQNFGTGTYPPPLGFGLGNFDIGSEYEIIFDFAGFIDTLGVGPAAYVIRTQDSSIISFGLLQFSGNNASTQLLKTFSLDSDMNMAAMFTSLGSFAIPDLAPDFGHGLLGSELGSSWVTEMDSGQVAAYPLSGTVAAGDSAKIFVKVAAAYPQGTYSAKLVIQNNSATNPLEVPVEMQIGVAGQPVIAVNPPAISDSIFENSGVQTYSLEIQNSGNGQLYFILEDSLVTGSDWLNIPVPFGVVAPGNMVPAEFEVDPAQMTVGAWNQAIMGVFSNDPNQTEIVVPVQIFVEPFTGINDHKELPKEFKLYANFPNPFNPQTEITYDLPMDSKVLLEIYNILGQKVATLVDSRMAAGKHIISWDARDAKGVKLPSGVYIYRLEAGQFESVKKMVLAR